MDVQRHNYALALTARASRALSATLSLDGGVNDDARYFGTPLRNGQLMRACAAPTTTWPTRWCATTTACGA